jgi:hypothetical protein
MYPQLGDMTLYATGDTAAFLAIYGDFLSSKFDCSGNHIPTDMELGFIQEDWSEFQCHYGLTR